MNDKHLYPMVGWGSLGMVVITAFAFVGAATNQINLLQEIEQDQLVGRVFGEQTGVPGGFGMQDCMPGGQGKQGQGMVGGQKQGGMPEGGMIGRDQKGMQGQPGGMIDNNMQAQQENTQPTQGFGQMPQGNQGGMMSKSPSDGMQSGQMMQKAGQGTMGKRPCPESKGQNQGFGNQGMGQNMIQGQQGGEYVPDERQFEMMKKNATRMTGEIARIKKQVAVLEKKGVSIPQELKEALVKMDEIAAKVKTAKDADELFTAMDDMRDAGDTIHEWMPKLGRLAALPQFIKRVESEIKKVNSFYTSAQARAKKAKLDLTENFVELRSVIDAKQAELVAIKAAMKADPETAVEMMDDFFQGMDNMFEQYKVIEVSLNIKQGIVSMAKELKVADQKIAALKKKKIDTTQLSAILAEAKVDLEEVKVLANAKPLDAGGLIIVLEAFMEDFQVFKDTVQELTGEDDYTSGVRIENYQFNAPQGFSYQGQ